MATEFPLAGSFTTYSARFVDEPFGFVSSELGRNFSRLKFEVGLIASLLLPGYRMELLLQRCTSRSFFSSRRSPQSAARSSAGVASSAQSGLHANFALPFFISLPNAGYLYCW